LIPRRLRRAQSLWVFKGGRSGTLPFGRRRDLYPADDINLIHQANTAETVVE
jgi:hypothetical protein